MHFSFGVNVDNDHDGGDDEIKDVYRDIRAEIAVAPTENLGHCVCEKKNKKFRTIYILRDHSMV